MSDHDMPAYFPPALARAARRIELARGAALFREGDPVGGIFLVLSGEIKAVRHLADSAEVVMMRAGAGEFFAESAIAAPLYTCDALAVKPSRLLFLPRAALDAALREVAFARAFFLASAANARRQCSRYERVRLRSARARLLHMLACEGSAEGVLDWPGPLSELAVELALEPETLYRVLRELTREGVIAREKRRIRLIS